MTAATPSTEHITPGQFVVVAAGGAALTVAPFMNGLLPEQYLRDAAHLEEAMGPRHMTDSAASFQDMAAVYLTLGLDRSRILAALLGIIVFGLGVLAATGWRRLGSLHLWEITLCAGSFVPALAYLAQYTKELATSVLVLLILLLPTSRSRRGQWAAHLVVVMLCLLYGAALRPYWIIVAGLYLLWTLVLSRTASLLVGLAAVAISYAVIQPLFRAVLGTGLQGQRDWSNLERAQTGVEVHSQIASVMPEATGALGVLAAMIALAATALPWPLLLSGSPFHTAAGLGIAALWGTVLLSILRGTLLTRPAPSGGRPATQALEHAGAVVCADLLRRRRAAALLIAFLVVQALFEPDYGSGLKHLTPMLPLVLAVTIDRSEG